MVTVHFQLPDGCEQVINMPEVSHDEIQHVCNALKHDLHALHYDYYIAR